MSGYEDGFGDVYVDREIYTVFSQAKLVGTLDKNSENNYEKQIVRQCQDFAVAWKETINEGIETILYLKNGIAYDQLIKVENAGNYIDKERIQELKQISSKKFDLTKLIRLCEEINSAYSLKLYYAVAMLLRGLMDHVPPIFNKEAFKDVSSQCRGKHDSFKKNMQNLENSLRSIANSFMHTHIRKKETLPNKVQVEFLQDLDVLLSEICRRLK